MYGIWLSPKGVFHTLKVCRHHGLAEAYLCSTSWNCLLCARQQMKGTKTGKIPGCSSFVGIEIAEKVLEKAFKVMRRAKPHESYDFYCGNNFKIDSKCSTSVSSNGKVNQTWQFHIGKNKVPNDFCLIALDNTPENVAEDPRPIHVWLIPGNAIIDGRPLNDRITFSITPRNLKKVSAWRRTDMEGKVIKCCNKIKKPKPLSSQKK